MINKILVEYIASNRRLVIPGLGAFIRKETDNSVVFVPFLKKDDGVLTQLVRENFSLSSQEAVSVIEEYATQVAENIRTSGGFVVDGVGVLRKDDNGMLYLDGASKVVVSTSTATPASSVAPPSAEPIRTISEPIAPKVNVVPPVVASSGAATAKPVSTVPPVTPIADRQPVATPRPAVTTRPAASQSVTPRPAGGYQQPAQRPAQQPIQQSVRQPAAPVRPAVSQTPQAQPIQSTRPSEQTEQRTAQQQVYQQPQARSEFQQRPVSPTPRAGMPGGAQPPYGGGRPARPEYPRQAVKRNKTDMLVVIAIIAAVLAVAAIVYGLVMPTSDPDFELNIPAPAAVVDTVQTTTTPAK